MPPQGLRQPSADYTGNVGSIERSQCKRSCTELGNNQLCIRIPAFQSSTSLVYLYIALLFEHSSDGTANKFYHRYDCRWNVETTITVFVLHFGHFSFRKVCEKILFIYFSLEK